MSLVDYVKNLVDELTEGRHSLLRETAGHLRLLSINPLTKVETGSVVADQTATSLHLAPQASIALQALLQIKLQKIDMSALINKPEELFLSEEEWAGKGLRVKRKEMENQVNLSVHRRAKKSADADAMVSQDNVERQADAETCSNNGAFEMEGPEELAGVLEYVANLIVELNQRVSVGSDSATGPHVDQASSEGRSDATTKPPAPEDPTLRNLRLNLLALAKRAPLDMIARLPLELVPEHIRHYIPMLDSSGRTASTSGVSTPATSSISTISTTTASPTSSNS
jgi:bromodomain-containing protein 7/9